MTMVTTRKRLQKKFRLTENISFLNAVAYAKIKNHTNIARWALKEGAPDGEITTKEYKNKAW